MQCRRQGCHQSARAPPRSASQGHWGPKAGMEGGRQPSLIFELYLVFVNFWLFGCSELMVSV